MTEELREPGDLAAAAGSSSSLTTGEDDSSRGIAMSADGELWLGGMDLPGMDTDDAEE